MSIDQSLILMLLFIPGNCLIHVTSSCTCPDYTLTYEGTVMGEGSTVWKGSVFDCDSTNNEITLLHSRFNLTNDVAPASCNNGAIVGQGVRVNNNNYTSQINVTLRSELVGKDIKCSHDNGTSVSPVGNTSIFITGTCSLACSASIIVTTIAEQYRQYQCTGQATSISQFQLEYKCPQLSSKYHSLQNPFIQLWFVS